MADSEVTPSLARLLQDHPDNGGEGRECGCGEWRAWMKDGEPNGCYEEHVEAVLLASFVLVPKDQLHQETQPDYCTSHCCQEGPPCPKKVKRPE